MNKLSFLLTISILIKITPSTQAQGWSNTGQSYPSTVFTMAEFNSALQVGGAFSSPNEIRSMCVYNGDLYSGGTNLGAPTNVYKNGTSIGAVNGGSNLVFAMAVFNNYLYVAGSFANINGVPANNIARWDGTVWSDVAGGVGNPASDIVYALGFYNNELYVAGNFNDCFKWNGATWSGVASFTSSAFGAGTVRGFGVYNGDLYAGGFFDNVNGAACVNIAKYSSGGSWKSAGDIGVAGDPANGLSALREYSGQLYCGGSFSIAGGVAAENIAQWNGSGWSAVGTGTDGVVTALLVFDHALYAGGNFSHAGGVSVDNIAKWVVCTPPSATITYSGSSNLCLPGGSILLNANTGPGLTYQWKKNGNIISGATAATYNVTVAGTYKVVVANALGCSATSSVVAIGSNTVFASISPPGPISICSGGSTLLNAYANGGYTYQWKKNGVIISGANSSTYNATSSGSYTVEETGGPCTKTSNPVTVTVNPLPSATINAGGPTTFCSGGSVVLNVPLSGNQSYQWKKGGVNISGATSSSYTATNGGTYKATVTNTTTGCSKTSANGILITVKALPVATITPQGPTTFCAGGSVLLKANTGVGLTYKWKKGSNYITGGTSKNYTATTAGTYKVEVTNSTGCSKISAGVIVTVPCREGEDLITENTFNIFPNPATIEISINLFSSDDFQIEIVNIFGEIVVKEQNQNTIDISNLATGVYFIKVIQGNNFSSQKFLKQ